MIMMAKRTFELPFNDYSLVISFDHSLLNTVLTSYLLAATQVSRLMSGQVELMLTQATTEI